MKKTRIELDGAVTYGPYSPGILSGPMVWLSGQIAPDAGDFKAQVQATLDKIDALLAAAGTSKHHATFVQVLLDDINDFAALNEVYSKWLDGVAIPPARAAFEAGALPAQALVEIVVQAVKQE